MASQNAGILLILIAAHLCAWCAGMMPIGAQQQQLQMPVEQQQQERDNRQFLTALRLRALQNLQRSLESLSSLTANSLMLNAALQSSESAASSEDNSNSVDELWGQQQQEESEATEQTAVQHSTMSAISSAAQQDDNSRAISRAHRHGVRRFRADLKQIPAREQQLQQAALSNSVVDKGTPMPTETPNGRRPNSRRMRSTNTRHGHGHSGNHKRRRKGCPSVHGKDQLLCPTRNTHRYDVCITREQLCDRVRDCPGGEDEDSRHCFFFRPLETSLKTISHAVLLLVDTVMREQEEHQQQQQSRNEL